MCEPVSGGSGCSIARNPAACAITLVCDPPACTSPPAAATGPAEGYFARRNWSAVVPVAHPPPSNALRPAFVHFSRRFAHACVRTASRCRFRVRECYGIRKYMYFGLKLHLHVRSFPAPPPLDLATIFFSGMCLRYTCLMFYVCFVVFCVFCLFIFLLHAHVSVGTYASCFFFYNNYSKISPSV